MKNQTLFRLFSICFLLLPSVCFAQTDWYSRTSTTFKNGFTIADKIEITPKLPQNSDLAFNKKAVTTMYDRQAIDGNTIYRIFKDNVNKTYFGYDFEVKEAGEKGDFTVLIKPLSSEEVKKSAEKEDFTAQPLPKYPSAIKVNEGDTISLVLLENPATKQKIVDYIKIFKSSESMENFFNKEEPIKDFTLEDVKLKLTNFEVFAGNQSIAKSSSGASAANVWFYLKGKGRFIFSLFPRAGYNFQKIGAIEGSRILFKYDGVDYEITSSQPIAGYSGHWNLWVLHDPNYKSPYAVGASDKVEFLFPKQ